MGPLRGPAHTNRAAYRSPLLQTWKQKSGRNSAGFVSPHGSRAWLMPAALEEARSSTTSSPPDWGSVVADPADPYADPSVGQDTWLDETVAAPEAAASASASASTGPKVAASGRTRACGKPRGTRDPTTVALKKARRWAKRHGTLPATSSAELTQRLEENLGYPPAPLPTRRTAPRARLAPRAPSGPPPKCSSGESSGPSRLRLALTPKPRGASESPPSAAALWLGPEAAHRQGDLRLQQWDASAPGEARSRTPERAKCFVGCALLHGRAAFSFGCERLRPCCLRARFAP